MRALFLLSVFLLAACSETDRVAERVEEVADDRADAMEARSERLDNNAAASAIEQQAETVREAGEERAEAIRESELDASELSTREKAELIRGGQ